MPGGWGRRDVVATPIGRNRAMFDPGMRAAMRHRDRAAEDLLRELRAQVCGAFRDADQPYRESELVATARSIERYRAQIERDGDRPVWIARQKARAARQKGSPRRGSVSPFISNEASKPWVSEGVSRATW